MLKTRVQGLICGGVTSTHLAPPSKVAWMLPSSLPAHITLTSSGEGARAVMAPDCDGVTVAPYLPVLDGTSQVFRVRSPEMAVQLWPPLVDFQTPAVA